MGECMRIIRAAVIGATCIGTLVAGASVAAAAVRAPGDHRWISGTEHFQIVGTSVSGSRSKVAAYGLFNASGADHTITGHVNVFRFGNGSFRVTHKPVRSRQHFSKVTCSGTFYQRGVYRLSHGRGRYAGIRGHGHYVLHGLLVTRHTAHGCGHKPVAVHTVIDADGPTAMLP